MTAVGDAVFRGRFFDGERGGGQDVEIAFGARSVTLRDLAESGNDLLWPLPDIRALPDESARDRLILACRSDTVEDGVPLAEARLVLTEPAAIAAFKTACPSLSRRDAPQGTGRKVALRLTLAAAATALMLLVILPAMAGTLARLIPPEREAQWGRSVVAQVERVFGGRSIGELVCRNDAGEAALQVLLTRLLAGTDVGYDLEVKVFDHGMVNAFAAPGGQIVLLRGLIEEAESPDEVAAVLAHEIAHVEFRDATRATLRAAGSAGLLAMMLGDFAGGSVVVVMAETVLNGSYSREAEQRADRYAHQMLDAAGISVAGMAAFFDRLAEIDSGFTIPEYLSSHPSTKDRADRSKAAAQSQTGTAAALSDADWKALRRICT